MARGRSQVCQLLEDEEGASIARVFIDGEWDGDPEEARAALDAVCDSWPEGRKVEFFALCGGFLRFRWPEGLRRWDIEDPVHPREQVMSLLQSEGRKCVESLLDASLKRKLRTVARYIVSGVDTWYFVDSCSDPHAELLYMADLKSGSIHATGKSYPNPRQQCGLVRNAALDSHFVKADGKEVMLLKCHDLNMFSPRSRHNARGWRSEVIDSFRKLATERKTGLLIWHPHKCDTPRTWYSGLGGLKKLLPDIEYSCAGGVYYNDGKPPRASLEKVRCGTKNIPTVDFLIKSDMPRQRQFR